MVAGTPLPGVDGRSGPTTVHPTGPIQVAARPARLPLLPTDPVLERGPPAVDLVGEVGRIGVLEESVDEFP